MPAPFNSRSAGKRLTPSTHRAPPHSDSELLARAATLAGRPLSWLAAQLGTDVPADLRRDKGWAGQLLEAWLGASAGALPLPDFPELGIELKTLPVAPDGRPLESTYVCNVDLSPDSGDWEASLVWRKLRQVLWVPIIGARGTPPGERRLGSVLLWRPSTGQTAILRRDWEELMELVAAGELDRVSARLGHYLQIRPKAVNASALTRATDNEGNPAWTLPRGFYLRSRFTLEILKEHYFL